MLATEGRIIPNDVIEISKDLQTCNTLRTSVPVPRMADAQLWEALVPTDVIFGAQPTDFLEYRFENIPVTVLERRARVFAKRMLVPRQERSAW